MPKKSKTAPVPLEKIKNQVIEYKRLMHSALEAHNAKKTVTKKVDLNHQYLQFYIDKPAMMRLLKISLEAECDEIGVFFGLDDGQEHQRNNKVTACFIGLNKKKEIIQAHLGKALDRNGKLIEIDPLLGEENWPPPPEQNSKSHTGKRPFFTVASNENDIEAYFSVPPKKKSTKKK